MLSYSTTRGTPCNALKASTCPRKKLSSDWSSMKTACKARDQLNTRTKADSRRVARPMVTVPKLPQSAWPCSPASRFSRRYAVAAGAGRRVRTARRSEPTEPGYPRLCTIANSRVARSRGSGWSVAWRNGR